MTKLSIVTVLIGSLLAPQAATAAALTPAEWLSLRGALDGAAAERGAALYEQNGCGGCHGPRGVPEHRNLPVLAGQRSAYLYKQLLDYRSKRLTGGTGEVMAGVSASLS
ncbi:MAG: c-type cytochrome, partial [Methylococcaceae bacterium]|nr:c-type cytochrome [Methylococcaceae bacterium]